MMALPAQIECCEREGGLTNSKMGVLAQGIFCQDIYFPIFKTSALRVEETRLVTALSTIIIIVGGNFHA